MQFVRSFCLKAITHVFSPNPPRYPRSSSVRGMLPPFQSCGGEHETKVQFLNEKSSCEGVNLEASDDVILRAAPTSVNLDGSGYKSYPPVVKAG